MGFYDGYLHIVIIYAMGAAAFYIYLQHLSNPSWLELLTIPDRVPVHEPVRVGRAQAHHASAYPDQRAAGRL